MLPPQRAPLAPAPAARGAVAANAAAAAAVAAVATGGGGGGFSCQPVGCLAGWLAGCLVDRRALGWAAARKSGGTKMRSCIVS